MSDYRSKSQPAKSKASAGLVSPILVLLVAFWIPVGIWLIRALADKNQPLIYTGEAFSTLMRNTAIIAGLTTVMSLALSYPLALLWWISGKRTSVAIASVAFLPFLVGLLARNYSWIGLLSADSLLASLGLSIIDAKSALYTIYCVILVMTYIFVPIAYFILLNALNSISPYEVQAAQTAGASGIEIITKLAFPHTLRQASIGAFIIFANALGYFVTPKMVGGGNFDMIGNLIWRYTNSGWFGDATSVSTTFLLWFSPFYVVSFGLIIQNRKKIIGR